jgi:hypothetical protein
LQCGLFRSNLAFAIALSVPAALADIHPKI